MKNIKRGTVEILGYIGVFIWIAVIFLREMKFFNAPIYLLLLGILPNLGAAWIATLLGKWFVILKLKKDVTVKIHLALCLVVFVLALSSEIFHDLFLSSPFDFYDIVMTFIAQIMMFFLPIMIKDRYFRSYSP